MEAKPHKIVYTVVNNKEKSFWVRIGACFHNRDGSWNVKLDAIPTNGSLQIRDPEERRDELPGAPQRRALPPSSGTTQVEAFA